MTATRAEVAADIRAAIEFIRDHPYHNVCGTAERPHVVHPKSRGWALCGNCMQPVDTGPDGPLASTHG